MNRTQTRDFARKDSMEDLSPTATAPPKDCWSPPPRSFSPEPFDPATQVRVTFDIPRTDSVASSTTILESDASRSHSVASTSSMGTIPSSRNSWSSLSSERKHLGSIRIDTFTESHYSPISSRNQSFAIIPNSPAPIPLDLERSREQQPLRGILKEPQAFSHESLSPKTSCLSLTDNLDPNHVQSETSKGKQPMRNAEDDLPDYQSLLPENTSTVPNLWEIPIDNAWGPGFRLVSLQLGSILWEAKFHHPKFGHFYAGDNEDPLQNPQVLAILLDQKDINKWGRVDHQIRHLCDVYWKNAPPIRYWVKGTTPSRT